MFSVSPEQRRPGLFLVLQVRTGREGGKGGRSLSVDGQIFYLTSSSFPPSLPPILPQVSKVLQGDPDKVLEPYIKGKGAAASLSTKAYEASERLGLYKQPVAFGFYQVGKVLREEKKEGRQISGPYNPSLPPFLPPSAFHRQGRFVQPHQHEHRHYHHHRAEQQQQQQQQQEQHVYALPPLL